MEAKESLYVEVISSREGVNFDNIDEVFKYVYDIGVTSKLCQTLEELAIEFRYNSVDNMLEEECGEVLYDRANVKEYVGKIIDPDGKENIISTENMSDHLGLFSSYCYEYDISQNGSYEFKYIGDDGKTAEITVYIDENNPCVVAYYSFNSTTYRLMAGVGNYLDFDTAKVNVINYKDINSPDKDNINVSEYIDSREIKLYNAGGEFKGSVFDAEIVLGYSGKEYKYKSSISLIPQ